MLEEIAELFGPKMASFDISSCLAIESHWTSFGRLRPRTTSTDGKMKYAESHIKDGTGLLIRNPYADNESRMEETTKDPTRDHMIRRGVAWDG